MTHRPQAERALFVATADQMVTNTTVETTAIGTGWGSLELPANYLQTASRFHIVAGGTYDTPITSADVTVRLKLGSTTIASNTTSALINPATAQPFGVDITMTCRTVGATGKVVAHGSINYKAVTGRVFDELDNQGTEVTIDTTAIQSMDMTVQWDSASSSRLIKVTSFSVTQIN